MITRIRLRESVSLGSSEQHSLHAVSSSAALAACEFEPGPIGVNVRWKRGEERGECFVPWVNVRDVQGSVEQGKRR